MSGVTEELQINIDSAIPIKFKSNSQNKIANAVINGIFDLTTVEFRLICALASQVPKKNTISGCYSISVNELGALMNLNVKNQYAQLEESCISVVENPIYVEAKKERGKKAWVVVPWFDFIAYNEGTVYFQFKSAIQPYLIFVSTAYVAVPTKLLMQFRSFYSIRLYLLLQQWYDTEQYEKKMTLESFKVMFKLGEKYKSYTDFFRFVLKPAIGEVEKLTDLRCELTVIKIGKRVSDLIWKINRLISLPEITDEKELKVFELLKKCKCGEKSIRRYIKKYSFERIIRNAEYTLRQKNVIKPAAYVRKAIEDDYGLNKSSSDSKITTADETKDVVNEIPQNNEEDIVLRDNQLKELYSLTEDEQKIQFEKVLVYIKQNENIQNKILERFNYLSIRENPIMLERYLKIMNMMKDGNNNG